MSILQIAKNLWNKTAKARSRKTGAIVTAEFSDRRPAEIHPGFSAQFKTHDEGMIFSMSRRAVQNCKRVADLLPPKNKLIRAGSLA